LVYRYKNFVYNHDYGKARLYKGDHLLFKGNAWSGILMFLNHTDNAPEVRQMFKAQLEQREKPKIKDAQKFQNEAGELASSTNEPVTKTKKTRTKTKSIWDS
jgi:hypothetical protein